MDAREREALGSRTGQNAPSKRKRQHLPVKVELAIGMEVMVTTNIETDLDIFFLNVEL